MTLMRESASNVMMPLRISIRGNTTTGGRFRLSTRTFARLLRSSLIGRGRGELTRSIRRLYPLIMALLIVDSYVLRNRIMRLLGDETTLLSYNLSVLLRILHGNEGQRRGLELGLLST